MILHCSALFFSFWLDLLASMRSLFGKHSSELLHKKSMLTFTIGKCFKDLILNFKVCLKFFLSDICTLILILTRRKIVILDAWFFFRNGNDRRSNRSGFRSGRQHSERPNANCCRRVSFSILHFAILLFSPLWTCFKRAQFWLTRKFEKHREN